MPRGDKRVAEKGKETRFSGEKAVKAAKKSVEVRRIKKTLRDIAHAALYQKPPLSKEQLKPVAEYYGIDVSDITIAEVALFKQVAEALKGDRAAFELIANYAGEKPADHVEIVMDDYAALDEAFSALDGDGA